MSKKDLFSDLEITSETSLVFPGQVRTPEVGDPELEEEEVAEEPEEQEPENEEPEAEQEQPEAEEAEAFSYEPFFQDLVAEGILQDKEGEEGYEDSLEGFRQAVKDAGTRAFQQQVATLPETARRIMELASKGASEEDIQQLLSLEEAPSWEDIDLSDEDLQRAAVEEAMRLRDPQVTDEEIQEELEDLADLGKLYKRAEKDQKYLVAQQKKQLERVAEQVAEREQQAKAAYEQEVQQVQTYVSGVEAIAGYKLTKEDREGFMRYLTVKDKDGKTQAEKNNSAERRIQKEFLNYKDFNVRAVERQALTEVTKNVKKQLARYQPQGGNSQPVRVEKQLEGAIGKIVLPGRS